MKLEENKIHLAFEISIVLKGLYSIIEIASGAILWFISRESIIKVIQIITLNEITEDPRDFIATHLYSIAQQLTISGQHFAALYLLSHGFIKFILIINLFKKRLWSYPLAIIILGLFIIYQIYRYTFSPSNFLIFLTVLDIIVIFLTWHEYRYLKNNLQKIN